MFDDLLNTSPPLSPPFSSKTKTREIKEWVRRYFALKDDVTIMVSELQCGETDCPDVETVIALLGGDRDGKKIKINKSIADIGKEDITSLV